MKAAAAPASLRRRYRGEEEYFELLDRVGHRPLRSAFIAAGLTAQVAGGLVWFIDDQRHLDRHQVGDTRTRYRAILSNLDPAHIAKLADGAIPG